MGENRDKTDDNNIISLIKPQIPPVIHLFPINYLQKHENDLEKINTAPQNRYMTIGKEPSGHTCCCSLFQSSALSKAAW